MFLTKVFVILTSVLVICGLTEQATLNNTEPFSLKLRPDSEIGPQQLVYLGSVDGATYYVEQDINRNWADAKKLCEGFGVKLKLAQVRSRAQYDFLLKNLQQPLYWLGGHEDMGENAFIWEETYQNPVKYGSFYRYLTASARYWCLTLRTATGTQGFQSERCSKVFPTICQLYPSVL